MAKIKRRKLPNDSGLTHPQEMLRRTLERKSRVATDPLLQWKVRCRIAITLKRRLPRPPVDRYPPDRLRAIRATSHNYRGALRR